MEVTLFISKFKIAIQNVEKLFYLSLYLIAVSVHDIYLREPYKSSIQYDQQVVSRCTMPRAILKAYGHCDPIPALDKLNLYR